MAYLGYQHKRARRRILEKKLKAQGLYGDVVQQGPFAGLRYPAEGYVSCRFQKIVGVYEHELHPLLGLLVNSQAYDFIIDIGAAEGYFAVGLALKFPSAKNVAFEMSEYSRKTLHQVATLNQVQDRLQIEGRCSPETLNALSNKVVPGRTLVVCDVDGYEVELMARGGVTWLNQADILIELHDCLRPGITEIITQAFSSTHKLTMITNSGIAYGNYPILRELQFPDIYAMVNEDRKGLQDWIFMTPNPERHDHIASLAK